MLFILKVKKVVEVGDIVLPGQHNLENILAAMSIAKLLGVSNEAITAVLKTFYRCKTSFRICNNYKQP